MFYIKTALRGKYWAALPAGPVFRPSGGRHVKKEVEEKRESNK
jgi:hypothetical protein